MAGGESAQGLAQWCGRWGVAPDGPAVRTATSLIQPVTRGSVALFLKLALTEEERRGNGAMAWWSTHGAGVAPVLEHDGPAILMARGGRSLADLPREEEAATLGNLCAVIASLHEQAAPVPAGLASLHECFADLFAAARSDLRYGPSAGAADELLSRADETVLLHGDIHHGNVLDFGEGGWRAIDPKGLTGPRGFDYANLFCNPDHETAADPGLFAMRLQAVCALAAFERAELARWILAWAGLSAVWMERDGRDAATPLAVMALAGAWLVS